MDKRFQLQSAMAAYETLAFTALKQTLFSRFNKRAVNYGVFVKLRCMLFPIIQDHNNFFAYGGRNDE